MAKRLTALTVKSAKLKPGRYGDGGGLYLVVRESGSRAWIFRWRERTTGKQRDLGLGSAGQGGVELEDARERAGELRAGLRRGVDPAVQREQSGRRGQDDTFGGFGDSLLESIKPGFKGRLVEQPL